MAITDLFYKSSDKKKESPPKVCPILSIGATNGGSTKNCLREGCQLWDKFACICAFQAYKLTR